MKIHSTLFTAAMLLPIVVNGQTGIAVDEMAHCDSLMSQFIDKHQIPGASFAMSKDGRLVYNRAFGKASVSRNENAQPHSIYRIASLSKPVTAIAVMKMAESGLLELGNRAFGPNGILADNTYLSTENDVRLRNITVQQLLEHSAGWDRNNSCLPTTVTPYNRGFNSCDPISFPLHVTSELSQPDPVTEEALIRFLMDKGLNFDPGSSYAYSNIGYLTLGLIIEKISGVSYENYVKTQLLKPLGIADMSIAKNLRSDRLDREVEYYGNGGTTLSVYGDGTSVPWEYGGFNIEAMDAHGGWLATAVDLVRLLNAVDGFDTKPDVLTTTSITTMTTPSAVNSNYAKGWSVNTSGNWWHTGSLDGTSSFMARTSGGYNWAVLLNKRGFGDYWAELDDLPWNCLRQTASFPAHDLTQSPSESASDITASKIDSNTLKVGWQNGDGNNRLLVASESTIDGQLPADGRNYEANGTFSQGDDIGASSFVVYNGPDNNTLLSGLSEGKTYQLQLFEYNRSTVTGNNALYKVSDVPSLRVEFSEGDLPTESTVQTTGGSGGGAMSLAICFLLLLLKIRLVRMRYRA